MVRSPAAARCPEQGKHVVVQVEEYERADGTKVRAHSRWHPGAWRELTVVAAS